MLLLPVSTALTLAHPPKATYATVALCCIVFLLQLNFPVTEHLVYEPLSWNPFTMITSAFAHAGWLHLIFNMIFFLAFTPALEAIIGSTTRFVSIILSLCFIIGICYSISILLGLSRDMPTLGFSGVVTGFIGLSAFLIPNARIRVFWWYIVFWKTFYIRAWIVALFFIGVDAWKLITLDDFQGINLVAHVAGGVAGYLYGYFMMQDRKQEIADELNDEIEEMKRVQRHGGNRGMQMRESKRLQFEREQKQQQLEYDRLMSRLYKAVSAKQDSEALAVLLQPYQLDQLTSAQVEQWYDRVKTWGPSRTLLCLGRLMIELLQQEKNQARAIYYIKQCQSINPQFLLPDLSQTVVFAQMALDTHDIDVAKHLLNKPNERYLAYVEINQLKPAIHRLKLELQI